MSRHGPIYDARTSGWGLEEWAHEARILRETQEAIMERRRDEANKRRNQLARVATLLLQYREVKKDEEEQGGDDE